MQPFSLPEALALYDRRRDPKVPKAQAELGSIRRLFPLDAWPAMQLEHYAFGQGAAANAFCHLIEVGSMNIGHWRGGTPGTKYIIYKPRTRPGWDYPAAYTDVHQAWVAVRAAFVKALARARAGDWETIDDIPELATKHMLKIKTLYIYFPQELLTVLTKERLQYFLRSLGRSDAAERLTGSISLNRTLLFALRDIPELRGWTTHELSELLHVGCGFRKPPA